MRSIRVPAHALLSVVVLSFIVSLMLSAMILLTYFRSTESIVYRNYIKAYRNIHSASEYILAGNTLLTGMSAIDLFQTGEDSISIQAIHWGLWEAAGFKAPVISGITAEKSMIYGCHPANEFASALWAPGISYGLGLTGNAQIKGNCFIGEGGIRTDVNVGGFSSNSITHLEGKVSSCSGAFMIQSPDRLQYLNKLTQHKWSEVFPAYELLSVPVSDSIYRSFTEPTLCIPFNGSVSISSVPIKGNCIVFSSDPITIRATARLEQVQIIAPIVIIETGFKGSIHVLATDSILVRSNVSLLYPSSLVLSVQSFSTGNKSITTESGSSVSGIVFSYQTIPDMNMSMIRIGENAWTRGVIYTNGYVELKGKHIGNISTMGFRYTTIEQTYTNVLPIGTIDYTALSTHFVIPVLTDKKQIFQAACWIQK